MKLFKKMMNDTDTCDYCKKEYPRAELHWVYRTAILTCSNCEDTAQRSWEDHVAECNRDFENENW